jgi:Tfp pilus assembly protein PilV
MALASQGRCRGFTLIEALLAVIIVALAILSLLAVIPTSLNDVQMNAIEVQAIAIGEQFLEDERNAKASSAVVPTATTVPIDPGKAFVGSTIDSYGNFSVSPDGCATAQTTGVNTTIYSCSVTVSWTETGASRSITVQSYVTK